MIPYCPGGPMSCQSAPAYAATFSSLFLFPKVASSLYRSARAH
ncbi:unnamed protein product, partial [Staurois parvus]